MNAYQNSIFMNSQIVKKIQKNKLEELRICVLKNNMVDVRIYFYFPNDPEPKPTKKGIWLSFKNLPKIIEGFNGLVNDNSSELSLEFEKSNTQKLKVYTQDFRNTKLVHLRTYYLKNEEYAPGRGVSFPIALLKDVSDALKESEKLKEE
ncbi:MAG: transcriptional coactivator p15/PC4 family protein [Elusimicrobiota bacterium]